MVQMRCSILLRLSASAFCSVTAGGASRKEYWLVLGWYNCSKPVAVLKLWAGLATREIHPEKILNVIPNQFPSIFIPTFFHNVLYLWHQHVPTPVKFSIARWNAWKFQTASGNLFAFYLIFEIWANWCLCSPLSFQKKNSSCQNLPFYYH